MTIGERIYGLISSMLKTGGYTDVVKVSGASIGVLGATYESGDVLGTGNPIELELVRGVKGTGIIQSLTVKDLSAQSGIIDFLFFDSLPTGTYTDGVAIDVSDADMDKLIGSVSVVAEDYGTSADSTWATLTGLSLVAKSLSNNKIWLVVVSRDTKTYVANELSLNIGILQD